MQPEQQFKITRITIKKKDKTKQFHQIVDLEKDGD